MSLSPVAQGKSYVRIINGCITELDSSRGLGAVIAERFGAEGANIAVNYVTGEGRALNTVAKIEATSHVKTVVIQGVCATTFIYECQKSEVRLVNEITDM